MTEQHLTIDGVDRRFLVGGSGTPAFIVLWVHGGSAPVDGAAELMAERITPRARRMDVFPNALVGQDGDVNWVRPDSVWLPPGVPDGQHDFRYFRAILDFCAYNHPGVPVFYAGYSGGAGFAMKWATVEALPFAGLALVKNTLKADEVVEGRWAAVELPRLLYWFARGDTVADQQPPKLTLAQTLTVLRATYETTDMSADPYVCGSSTVDRTRYSPRFETHIERHGGHGGHQWPQACCDERIDRFFRPL